MTPMVDARALLGMPALRLTVLVGDGGHGDLLSRPISRVYSTEQPEPGRYLSGGELVVSGLLWWRGAAEADTFVATLAAHGVAALAASGADTGGDIPEALVAACTRHEVALLQVPADLSFAVITETVMLEIASERGTAVLASHRRLLAAASEGGIAALLASGATELHVPVAVRTATGRLVASSGGRAVEVGVTVSVPDDTGRSLVGWSLLLGATEREWRSWPRSTQAVAHELAAMVGLTRTRAEQARRNRDEAARALLPALESGAVSRDELDTHLAAAGIATNSPMRVLIMRGHGAHNGFTFTLLDEVLAELDVPALVYGDGGDGYALAEVGRGWPPDVVARARAVLGAAEPWPRGCRVVLAFSGQAGAGGLRGAVEEARHGIALGTDRLAGQRERGVVIAGDDIAAHQLLLANLPDELRHTLRRRLLGDLEDYDAAHGGELLPTLARFLEHSCSPRTTAEAMHVHVNTIRYRIGRTEQLLGRDLSRFTDRVDLYLALHIDTTA